jgi:murein L,D-transpeptidase YcbB/YkuD
LNTLSTQAEPAAYLRSFHPSHPQFEALRKKLLELRSSGQAKNNGPVIEIPPGPLLKLGVEDPQVALLRQRLELPPGLNPNRYDEVVLEAVKAFQLEHDANLDGVVGPGTRQLLNAPHLRHAGSALQIKTILLNMERWRWLPRNPGDFYVMVNVPEFKLRVVENGQTIHTSRVIVGKPSTQTPIFSNEMETIVFGPYWNVPNSIKVEEIRPYLRQEVWFFGGGWDTSILKHHNLRVKYRGRDVDPGSLNWDRIDIRSLHIYQPPGPRNVLGKVKFLFPNKHDVYLHDTLEKGLFERQVRAESHGCVRVQNPNKLAAIILKRDQGWDEARTASAMENGYNQRIALNEKIPVYITYITARVNDDGSLSTFRDLYGHNARMAAALFGDSDGFDYPRPVQARERRENRVSRDSRALWDRAASNDIVDDIIQLLEY